MTPEERAKQSAAAMWENESVRHWGGFELEDVGPGHARMSMTVREDHVNVHGTCHGGVIFMLADTVFAYACNSYNQRAVAQTASISFTAPGKLGDRLVAEAHEVTLSGRSGIYDITVFCEGAAIAHFRGHSRTIRGQHFEENAS
jgi:acyl-CoA thioesterase